MSNLIDLSKHTTFGIGPTVFCRPVYKIEELMKSSSCFVLGKGSNILFLNKINRPVIINKTDKFLRFGKTDFKILNLLYNNCV